ISLYGSAQMRRIDHLVAVPNVSEGRDGEKIARVVASVRDAGARVLDVHSDPIHNRTVVTAGAEPVTLVAATAALALAATSIDLTQHVGVHPRLGVLDVCPFVVDRVPIAEVVEVARTAGAAISERAGLPVYLYGHAATRPECEHLPDIRRGGLAGLMRRAAGELPPDFGLRTIDPRLGVVCVGARGPLIAFNVWLRCDAPTARRIAAAVRKEGSTRGVRALGLDLGGAGAQVSMNLTDPDRAGIDDAYRMVASRAAAEGVEVQATELVGLPPERYLPDPDAEAARLLRRPGRSLERVLTEG
ncbi:MAG: glutamate formiminotransferase, partial [Actinomycetota bacterium]|nr:glutamate formiminotransferase [Actinomycetota bacterium]